MSHGVAAEGWRALNPARSGQVPLVELATPVTAAEVNAVMWQAWLADPDTRRRFEALVYRRGPDRCAYFLGAISSAGPASRSRSARSARPRSSPRDSSSTWARDSRRGPQLVPLAGRVGPDPLELGGVRRGHLR